MTTGNNSNHRSKFEVADIFNRYGDEFLRTRLVGREQRKALYAIRNCRTRVYGGHVDVCDHCGHERISYNSCRNRHCPKCQFSKQQQWLEAMSSHILPCPYFHVVFTVPHAFYALVPYNERIFLDSLFHAGSQALLQAVEEKLGVVPGITTVLHTWGQQMNRHLHLHCICTGGGLSRDQQRWVSSSESYLVDVKALSRHYRELYCQALRKAFVAGEFSFVYRDAVEFSKTEAFEKLLARIAEKDWVVYSKPPFAGPQKVLEYLSRYTHRVAISNRRIKSIADGRVTFAYRDYREPEITKRLTLTAMQFIGRFLLHILPFRYCKIRHFGIFAGRDRVKRLERCQTLLGGQAEVDRPAVKTVAEFILKEFDVDICLCPQCHKGHWQHVRDIPPPQHRPWFNRRNDLHAA